MTEARQTLPVSRSDLRFIKMARNCQGPKTHHHSNENDTPTSKLTNRLFSLPEQCFEIAFQAYSFLKPISFLFQSSLSNRLLFETRFMSFQNSLSGILFFEAHFSSEAQLVLHIRQPFMSSQCKSHGLRMPAHLSVAEHSV